jgi:hypothetical protein
MSVNSSVPKEMQGLIRNKFLSFNSFMTAPACMQEPLLRQRRNLSVEKIMFLYSVSSEQLRISNFMTDINRNIDQNA